MLRDCYKRLPEECSLLENKRDILDQSFALNIIGMTRTQSGLGIRLARSSDDILAAQRLRYHVFYDEMAASADTETRLQGLDRDKFDPVCDHLMVIEHGGSGFGIEVHDGTLVGTYRLLRQEIAEQNFGFYSQAEFDVTALMSRKPNLRFLELGRSCVLKPFRSKPVVELLWQGIWDYVRLYRLDVMLGCASFEGTDPSHHAEALSFLAHFAKPSPEWMVHAHPAHRVDMAMIPSEALNQKQALYALPPLIKGYLRLGCSIGDGAVVDHQFNTTDVLIILPVSQINPRYFARFGQPTV
jgi:L-ornithine Nalpha-acyltransferase